MTVVEERREQDVIHQIDDLVNWELSESPAAKVEAIQRELAARAGVEQVDHALDSLQELAELCDQADVDRHVLAEQQVARSRADQCRGQRRTALFNCGILVANLLMLVWNVAPVWWQQPPSMFAGVSLVATVLCVRLTINSVLAWWECRQANEGDSDGER